MKSLKFLLFAAVATILAACTKDDGFSNASYESVKALEPVPVAFGTYIGETAETRAGFAGPMTTDQLKESKANEGGFGIFAYYTDKSSYSSSAKPNFMYNQGVFFDGSSSWTYSPLKYWPNETANGVVDGNAASSTDGPDRVSFFAYAPYVERVGFNMKWWDFNPLTGEFVNGSDNYSGQTGVTGITKITNNDTSGDPKITYVVSDNVNQTVDLLWGVVPAGTSYTTAVGTPETPTVGLPNLNLTKQTKTEKIEFLFKHALAKLTFSVQGIFDEVTPGPNNVDSNTRIVIEDLTVATTYSNKGVLNLNNTVANTPKWESRTGAITLNVPTADIFGSTADAAGLRYSGTPDYNSQPLGVTNTKTYLSDNDGNSKFFALFPENSNLKITIKYHVVTKDSNLKDGFVFVTNEITKTVNNFQLEAGKWFNVNLQLGMTSVKVNASVSDWTPAGSETSVDLPINVAP